jgi:predicted SnoaL-like aldol condensation-catalyzing enzyme
MSDYKIIAGIAQSLSPTLYESWWLRSDYQDSLVSALGPAALSVKRLIMDFEAGLADVVSRRAVEAEIDGVLERFVHADYEQQNPLFGQGRAGLARWFREVGAHLPGTPPAPVALIAEDGLVTVLLELRLGGAPALFLSTLFRVEGSKLRAHWGGGAPAPQS